ncbi:MAG TPA: zinc ribbon domain-containing protein [Thermoplasmata archaeon]|nr:zinc ribbon domain-containing protein [Thermoplasmata archaeon]
MRCMACGAELPGDAVFCLKCGARVAVSPPPSGELTVQVSLGEIPYAVILKDIWLFVMVDRPVAEVKASVRPTDARGTFGEWLQGAVSNPRPGVLEQAVNLGDIVRWQFDSADVRLLVRTADGGERGAAAVLPLNARDVRKVELAPTAKPVV